MRSPAEEFQYGERIYRGSSPFPTSLNELRLVERICFTRIEWTASGALSFLHIGKSAGRPK